MLSVSRESVKVNSERYGQWKVIIGDVPADVGFLWAQLNWRNWSCVHEFKTQCIQTQGVSYNYATLYVTADITQYYYPSMNVYNYLFFLIWNLSILE
jgi:hypothetical protein